ncbi:Serpin I2 [Thelohanellus kitauei]|uniref:Serpin I2 n=1 Tax=Thelohanellus kitauei TaxID=669202 RepID=A0A0C2MY86_THEKT|nr:Serpin I2 [Thelohanellus kitauei]
MSSSSVNAFGNTMFRELYYIQHHKGNIAFSGMVIYHLMAVIDMSISGKTKEQLSAFLREDFDVSSECKEPYKQIDLISNLQSFREEVESCSKLKSIMFHSIGINERFMVISNHLVDLNCRFQNFSFPGETLKLVNKWIKSNTYATPKSPFDIHFESENSLHFINTFSFPTLRSSLFDGVRTNTDYFRREEGVLVEVTMMYTFGQFPIFYDPEEHVSYLFIPITNKNLHVAFILPTEDCCLRDFVMRMKPNHLSTAYALASVRNMHVFIPKFKISSSLHLKKAFLNNSVIDLFTNGVANITGITNMEGFIQSIVQIAEVEMDENIFSWLSPKYTEEIADTKKFNAIRPFMFYVLDKDTGLIILSSIINDPNTQFYE